MRCRLRCLGISYSLEGMVDKCYPSLVMCSLPYTQNISQIHYKDYRTVLYMFYR